MPGLLKCSKMPLKKIVLKIAPQHEGKRLDQALAELLPTAFPEKLSKGQVRKLIVAGAVYIGGRRMRIASKPVQSGARVDIYLDTQKLKETGRGRDLPFAMEQRHVLYEDESLIAVDKPAGLPTQPTLDEARDHLFAAVKRFIEKRDGIVQPYIGLHHRLDRDTSGVVLFTKKKEANAGISALFVDHGATKIYHALTSTPSNEIPSTWSVRNYLGRSVSGGKKARYTAVRSGGDFAHTDFKLIERMRTGLWIEAAPRTGRTHQIRVHLTEGGTPILGDQHYGAAKAPGASRMMLHARSLSFAHPITGVPVLIESPLPEDFRRCLEILRKS